MIVAVICTVAFVWTEDLPLSDVESAILTSLVTVTEAFAVELGLAWLAAVIVTEAGLGRSAGAVYRPVLEMVPTFEFPPAVSLTLQFTNVFEEPDTVAVNCCVSPNSTFMLDGETETVTVGGGGGVDEELFPPQPSKAIEMASSETSVSTAADLPAKCKAE